ncbi:CoA pyrophosphatase [Halomonas binhaiensis]|uniref:CoA pyrophosphatase n=1 Tax=Halomonas binhaiensis TaxID=2562282 RepID=A0A5C1NJF1_9GAMM|nr:CoA pyrophosphatase [Halomonas binhaiensis]QEM82437.1 CoA pyrophosphatase [Halomonas binhaiensis]
MLETLRQRLQAHRPRRMHAKLAEAAVLVPIVDRPEPTLLFTLRASHLSTHSGQVAFPGGKREPQDDDLLVTALRESEEEIALPRHQVTVIGQLSDVLSLHGLKVTPFVGIIPPDLPLVADENELDAIFEVPLEHFLEDRRTHTDVIQRNGNKVYIPSYRIPAESGMDDYIIWGLSAMMLVELMSEGFGLSMSVLHRPEGKLRLVSN